VPVVALVESAVGIENLSSIARRPSTARLAFGSGDFRKDTGIGDDPFALSYARSRLTIASRAARLPGPIDGPSRSTDPGVVKRETCDAKLVGMTGRLCLRGDQTAVVNEVLQPSRGEVAEARAILGREPIPGDPSEVPRRAQAEKILELANALGGGRGQ
jgi:citrate lyase subunit beta / citryl-CoA lyase